MIEFDELRLKLEGMKNEVEALRDALGLEQLEKEIEELENSTTLPGFWDDQSHSSEILKKISVKKGKVEMCSTLLAQYDDLLTLISLANEEEDLSLLEEITEGCADFEAKLSAATLSTLLTGEYDSKNALLTFHAVPLLCVLVYTVCMVIALFGGGDIATGITVLDVPLTVESLALLVSSGMGLFSYIDSFVYAIIYLGSFGFYLDLVFMLLTFIVGFAIGKSRRLKA